MTAQSERTARRKANGDLYALGLRYHESIPLGELDHILAKYGFNVTEEAIYCGRDGHNVEKIGNWSWFVLSWHRMDSGRYEIVAYVS